MEKPIKGFRIELKGVYREKGEKGGGGSGQAEWGKEWGEKSGKRRRR